MIHPGAELFFADPVRGHGARARVPIPAGTVVWAQCALDRVLSPAEAAELGPAYAELVEHFSYRDHRGHFVLCWDAGRYVNHSCRPSMRGLGPGAQIAVRDIAVGDEITCDYGECNLSEPLGCACGEPGCRGEIRGDDVLALAEAWDLEITAAVESGRGVEQPLRGFWLDPQLTAVLEGDLKPPSVRRLHCPGG